MKYQSRYKSKSDWPRSAEIVIDERIRYTNRYGYSVERSIEEKISEIIAVMGEMCDLMGIDASKFNEEYVKIKDEQNES